MAALLKRMNRDSAAKRDSARLDSRSSKRGKPSFENVYAEYYPRIFRFAMSKIGDRKVAEDLAQDVMVAAFRNYASFDPNRSSVSTWIFVIAHNLLKNYYRSRRTNESIDAKEGFDLPSGEALQDEAVEFQETCEMIERALAELDERERAIIEGFFYHGKTNVELAEELGMTASNVGVVKKRTLAKLRLTLTTLGYER